MAKQYPPLTAYRIHLSDGTSYITDMAADVTLEMAEAYFLHQWLTQSDEKTRLQVTKVEQVRGPQLSLIG